jgi:hypothetical protein
MADQDIEAAKERVRALRRQIREEQSVRAVAGSEAAREVKLEALSQEEEMLERQLAEIRNTVVPGEVDVNVVVPAGPEEGNVNVTGDPIRADQDPLAEGAAFTETVDAHGNLIRTPVALSEDATVELTPAGEAALTTPDDASDVLGTREADAPPPDVADDATMTSRKPRR